MAKTTINLKGNRIVADEFVGEATLTELPAITVGGVTVGPGTLEEVIEDLIALINTKVDA